MSKLSSFDNLEWFAGNNNIRANRAQQSITISGSVQLHCSLNGLCYDRDPTWVGDGNNHPNNGVHSSPTMLILHCEWVRELDRSTFNLTCNNGWTMSSSQHSSECGCSLPSVANQNQLEADELLRMWNDWPIISVGHKRILMLLGREQMSNSCEGLVSTSKCVAAFIFSSYSRGDNLLRPSICWYINQSNRLEIGMIATTIILIIETITRTNN